MAWLQIAHFMFSLISMIFHLIFYEKLENPLIVWSTVYNNVYIILTLGLFAQIKFHFRWDRDERLTKYIYEYLDGMSYEFKFFYIYLNLMFFFLCWSLNISINEMFLFFVSLLDDTNAIIIIKENYQLLGKIEVTVQNSIV